MKTVLFVILTAAITNNYVLVKFLGICPFLGVSKKLDQATGMSIAVIFVEVLATAVTWPIYHLLLAGKVDCVIIDDQVAVAFVKNNEGLKLLDTAYAYEEYAICFAKDSAIYQSFNEALEALIADGTVQGIIDKYIPAE